MQLKDNPLPARPVKHAVALTLVLGLAAACTSTGGTPFGSSLSSAQQAPLAAWQDVGRERALAEVDGADAVFVRQRQSGSTGLIQELTLSNGTAAPGSNVLVVAMSDGVSHDQSHSSLYDGDFRFDAERVTENAGTWLDGAFVSDNVSTGSNDYGVFDYMVARYSDEVTCVYAWQLIEDRRFQVMTGSADIAVQFRFCDAERNPLEIASLFSKLKFNI
jgi:hypothetical protein